MAGTLAVSDSFQGRNGIHKFSILATGDASDGSFPATTLAALGFPHNSGTFLALQTNPGGTAPTDNYDITLIDGDGIDRFNSVGLNRDTSTSERVAITGAPWFSGETLTLTIANNAVNSATVVITIYYTTQANTAPGLAEALSASVDSVAIGASATIGGVVPFKSLDLDESEETVKASAGQVYWIYAMNLRTSNLYLKLYNATIANVTVGTTVPDVTIPLASNATDDVGHMLVFSPPIQFSTAISAAATTGFADNDSGAPGANECIVTIGYL